MSWAMYSVLVDYIVTMKIDRLFKNFNNSICIHIQTHTLHSYVIMVLASYTKRYLIYLRYAPIAGQDGFNKLEVLTSNSKL